MDLKKLYKSSLVGNSVMRKNRAVKANVNRSTKRTELFSQGRDIQISPEPVATKKPSKKSEELAKKAEAYKARFAQYMEEKKKRLEAERKTKKAPFLNAVSATNRPVVKPATVKKIKPQNVEKTRQNPNKVASDATKKSLRPTITIKKIEKKIPPIICDLLTPLVTDKLFVFGEVTTSTARKLSADQKSENNVQFVEEVLSPIEGIEPLDRTGCEETANPKVDNPVTATTDLNETPTNIQPNEGNFYVSPFVTTSRGKVSAKKERKNRESVYKLELNQSIDEPLDVRRRREAVKYFRKLLSDETTRLHNICDTWETYGKEESDQSNENCTDMIKVAVGQTRLLTNGKFKQFAKLIDDCETFINTENDLNKLKSQQNILPEDLEGYWNSIKFQIENVDRRFENLTRWKNNYWVDPYEKPKPKKNRLAKKLKPHKIKRNAHPSDEVKNLLIKAHKEYLKNRLNPNEANQDIIFTKRRSIQKENLLITPINKKEPGSSQIKIAYRISLPLKENRVPLLNTPSQRRLSILRNARNDDQYKRRLSETPKSSSTRKSILKSEVKQSVKKSVLFASTVEYKSPNSFRDNHLDESHHLLQLRTRKVVRHDDFSD